MISKNIQYKCNLKYIDFRDDADSNDFQHESLYHGNMHSFFSWNFKNILYDETEWTRTQQQWQSTFLHFLSLFVFMSLFILFTFSILICNISFFVPYLFTYLFRILFLPSFVFIICLPFLFLFVTLLIYLACPEYLCVFLSFLLTLFLKIKLFVQKNFFVCHGTIFYFR